MPHTTSSAARWLFYIQIHVIRKYVHFVYYQRIGPHSSSRIKFLDSDLVVWVPWPPHEHHDEQGAARYLPQVYKCRHYYYRSTTRTRGLVPRRRRIDSARCELFRPRIIIIRQQDNKSQWHGISAEHSLFLFYLFALLQNKREKMLSSLGGAAHRSNPLIILIRAFDRRERRRWYYPQQPHCFF